MPITISVSISGSADEADKRAALLLVEAENTRRAAMDPPDTPLGTTPLATLATSYETVLQQMLDAAHLSYVQQSHDRTLDQQAKQLWADATDAQRAAAISALGG